MSQEQISTSDHKHEALSEQELSELKDATAERKIEQLEQNSPEHNSETEKASREALEQANSAEAERQNHNNAPEEAGRNEHAPRTAERDAAYNSIMDEVRDHMSPANRAFSKFIHAPAIERTSEAIGSTVARPNSILAGSMTAFAVGLLTYMVARHYGYTLSGTEAIAAFACGWVIGIVFDFLRVMITGKKA